MTRHIHLALLGMLTLLALAGCAIPITEEAPAPITEEAPAVEPTDEALTRAFVEAGIERYKREGLEAAVAHYNDTDSYEGDRYMMIAQAGDQTILAYTRYPFMAGSNTFSGPNTPFGKLIGQATPEGFWFEGMAYSHISGKDEPAMMLAVLHDGLIFVAKHSIVLKNLGETTQDYVAKAIGFYEDNGLDATIEYYGSRESMDNVFYLFLIGADDIYLAHPIFLHLVGTDIKDVVGSDGQELGKEIAQATEEGLWVEYLWPNPITGKEDLKNTWAVRHDGMIFASGHYTRDETAETPPWKGADPAEYTVAYVTRAVARYQEDGLEAMLNFYNSVASLEGQWYLFAADAEDTYIVHPIFPHLKGTDLKDIVGSDGQELGQELVQATEEGLWVEYLWPHPNSLQEVPKVAYAVRHEGILFASGYYPNVENRKVRTREYVDAAITMYEREGLEATVEYYNSLESIEGEWVLVLYGRERKVLTHPLMPQLVGRDQSDSTRLAAATPEGIWNSSTFSNPNTAEQDQYNKLYVLHDGLVFSSGYYGEEE